MVDFWHRYCYKYKKAWLSVSFAELKSKNAVKMINSQGFNTIHLYPKGSKVYHYTLKRAVKSNYLLVEAETKNWKHEEEKSILIRVQAPQNKTDFFVDIRASFRDENKMLLLTPDEYHGMQGQQGFSIIVYV